MIFVKKKRNRRPDPARPSPNNDGDNDETESGRGSRGRGGAVNSGDGNGGGVFLRAFGAFRATSPEQFPVSSFFPQKSFAWHPPRNQGGIRGPDKSSVATSGCIWFPTRRPRSGSFALDIWGVSRNGGFSEKWDCEIPFFLKKPRCVTPPRYQGRTSPNAAFV